MKKDGPNHGRWFLTCQVGKDNGCGFFLWEDDAKPREEAAVLSGKATEPARDDAQQKHRMNYGQEPQGKGLFAGNYAADALRYQRDASTASPTPPSSRHAEASAANGSKRSARDADLDDEFDLDMVTPQKANKTGIYATPATTVKRKLPWLEEPTTPATFIKQEGGDYFDTPSKQPTQFSSTFTGIETPAPPPTLATAESPLPPTRHFDALQNPADSGSSLTSEVLAALSSINLPSEVRESVRTICSRHDLRHQGVVKGRDISRLAIKAKDAKITELQARIASIEAHREVEKSLSRMKRWQSESRAE